MSSIPDNDSDEVPFYVRQFVFERDDWECQTCGALAAEKGGEREVEIHHKHERQNGGSHDPSNLSTLCEFCHRQHHGGPELDEVPIEAEELDAELTPADCSLLIELDQSGPARIVELADETGYSAEQLRRRAYRLAALGVLTVTPDREWDYRENVDVNV